MRSKNKKLQVVLNLLVLSGIVFGGLACTGTEVLAVRVASEVYAPMKALGKMAAVEARNLLRAETRRIMKPSDVIVLSNAGYAEIGGKSTMGALDGLSEVFRVSRGANTLVDVHSTPERPLWFAAFDSRSGYCAYLQVNSSAVGRAQKASDLFEKRIVAKIDPQTLYASDPNLPFKFGDENFDNTFSIVTIANGVAFGAPSCVTRSIEFHDHYCPGVTSGILIANYVKKYFADKGVTPKGYFVHGLNPWCKEDALMVMLNATPGKSGYTVTYSTAADRSNWVDYPTAVNIVYGQLPDNSWEGLILNVALASNTETGCSYTNGTISRLCADLWYLDKLDDPGRFVTLLKSFTLPATDHPKNYAKPGMDIMAMENPPWEVE
jgi:formylmethanofuran dehydrogenase subunit E-like metal-binding protein